MSQITPTEVIAGYERHGMRPTIMTAFGQADAPEGPCGCAIGPVYADEFGIERLKAGHERDAQNNFVYLELATVYGVQYLMGFGHGFDRALEGKGLVLDGNFDKDRGHNDGTIVGEAVRAWWLAKGGDI